MIYSSNFGCRIKGPGVKEYVIVLVLRDLRLLEYIDELCIIYFAEYWKSENWVNQNKKSRIKSYNRYLNSKKL